MTKHLKIALAQLNPVVGDLAGNADKLRKARARAAAGRAPTSCVFPELFITGYPPEDLVRKPAFAAAARAAVEALAARDRRRRARRARRHASGPRTASSTTRWRCSTAARSRRCASRSTCPTTACSTRSACSTPGPMPGPVSFRGVRIGVPICEDIWKDEVCECLQETGSEMLISPNGSPFDWPKPDLRMNVAVARVTETGLPLLYLNQIGGQDELVFDGASFVLNADCQPRRAAAGLGGGDRARRDAAHGADGWRCEPGQRAVLEERRRGRLSRLHAGPARLRRQERLSRRRAGPVGRHRFRARRGAWRSMRWGRSACTA